MPSASSVAPRVPQTTSPSTSGWLAGRSPAGAPARKPGCPSTSALARDAIRCWGNGLRLAPAPDHPRHGIGLASWPFRCGCTRGAGVRAVPAVPSDFLGRAQSERDRPDLCSTSPNRALRPACTLVRSSFFTAASGSVTSTTPALRFRLTLPVSHQLASLCQVQPASRNTSQMV